MLLLPAASTVVQTEAELWMFAPAISVNGCKWPLKPVRHPQQGTTDTTAEWPRNTQKSTPKTDNTCALSCSTKWENPPVRFPPKHVHHLSSHHIPSYPIPNSVLYQLSCILLQKDNTGSAAQALDLCFWNVHQLPGLASQGNRKNLMGSIQYYIMGSTELTWSSMAEFPPVYVIHCNSM